MVVWNSGGLNGYDRSPFEVAGRIVGKRPGEWRFDDGISKRWIAKEYIQSYRYLQDGYVILRLPSWLAKRRRYRYQVKRVAE